MPAAAGAAAAEQAVMSHRANLKVIAFGSDASVERATQMYQQTNKWRQRMTVRT